MVASTASMLFFNCKVLHGLGNWEVEYGIGKLCLVANSFQRFQLTVITYLGKNENFQKCSEVEKYV